MAKENILRVGEAVRMGKGSKKRRCQVPKEKVGLTHRSAFGVRCCKCHVKIPNDVEVNMNYPLCKECD